MIAVYAIILMTDDKFQAFVQNEANNLWSKAVRIERLEYEGR